MCNFSVQPKPQTLKKREGAGERVGAAGLGGGFSHFPFRQAG